MRSSLSVTNEEYTLNDGISMVSKTDLRGKITYVNPAFLTASGYSEQELLGENHNVVRHPDMPAELFTDLWMTLSERLPWTGMIKNRRKDGGYFWVLMNVTPLQKKPPAVGFMAVYNKPSPRQIDEAELAYQAFREGRAAGMTIHHGRITRHGLAGFMDSLRRIPVRRRVMWTTIAAAILMWTLGGLSWWEFASAPHSTDEAWLPVTIATGSALGGILLLLFGYFISQTILIPIDHALEVAHAISWGDLSLRFEMNAADETAELMLALNQMKSNLVAVMSDTDSLIRKITELTDEPTLETAAQQTLLQSIRQQANKLAQVVAIFRSSN